MLPKPAFVEILGMSKEALDVGDWETNTGVDNVTIRHYRHRKNAIGEKPCIGLLFLGDGPPEEDTFNLSHSEALRQMDFQLVVDCDIPTEDSDEDPTGLETPGRLMAYGLKLLKDPAGPLYPNVHEVFDGPKDLDEASTPDKARMTRTISVLYRVKSEDEDVRL